MKHPGHWIAPVCLILAIASVGCGSNSSFFRARNPFQDEADAIADYKTRKRLKKPEGETPIDVPEPPREPGPRSTPYFGQSRNEDIELPFLPKKDPSDKPVEPATTESLVPPPGVPLSRKETVTAPRPATTGAVCYRCNGKGHHLSSLAADARRVECADCTGTGRR